MNKTMIINLVAFLIYAILIFTLRMRRKLILKKAGKCFYNVVAHSIKFPILIIICCFLIIFFSVFVNLKMLVKIVLCSVAVLGAEIGIREIITLKCSGIYENGIITEGNIYLFEQINAVRTFSEKSEISGNQIIEIELNNKVIKQIIYKDTEERDKVLDLIFELKPSIELQINISC